MSGPEQAAQRSHRAALVLNAVLGCVLAVLVVWSWSPMPASAQGQAPARARGEYTMVSGKTGSGSAHALYVVDGANSELVVFRWDQTRKEFLGFAYRSLDADTKAPMGR
ncbi:MAG: hypothetical protein FJ255_05145 [Phycisphaerae bacterium]|nr:hypothetical protein [Phycisphaerae bacterium]